MEDGAELVAQHLPEHYHTDAFEATTRGAGTTSNEHTHGKDDPCDMWPLASVIVEDACGGEEGDNLEEAGAESICNGIVATTHDDEHDKHCAYDDYGDVKAELAILEELLNLVLEDGQIQQRETGATQEHKEDGRVVDGGILEVACAGIVRGKASRGRDGHRVVETIEATHALKIEA